MTILKKHCKHCGGKKNLVKSSRSKGKLGTIQYFMCGKCNTERCKEYRKTAKGKEAIKKAVTKFDRENKEKRYAWGVVQLALKCGKLKKAKRCARCKRPGKLVAHHSNYNFPLRVRWVHYLCHKAIHKANKKRH